MIFYGIIEDGILRMLKGNDLNGYIKKQKKKGRFRIEIKRERNIRSLDQNNLYWLWLGIMGNDLGYDLEELHTSFRAMFLKDRTQRIPLIRSTAKLNKLQFGQYLDKIQRVASELGIVLPDPEEYKNNAFMSNFE